MSGNASRQNGKLGGRPKGFAALEAERQRDYVANKLVKEYAPIVTKAIQQAKSGDKFAREWLADRAFGKVSQSITGVDGGAIEIVQQIIGMTIKNGTGVQHKQP